MPYSRLQDEYYDFITSRGYDLERGEKGSTAEHLSVAEYKLKKTAEQLAPMSEQIAEIENIEEVKATNLPLNTVAIKREDFEMLSAAAKNYVGAKNAEKEERLLKMLSRNRNRKSVPLPKSLPRCKSCIRHWRTSITRLWILSTATT